MFSKNQNHKLSQDGFSLIELLLVAGLAPIVFFAVYMTFSSGVNLWQKLKQPNPEEDLVIFSQKTQQDFQNSIKFSSIVFSGTKDEVSFPAAIHADKNLGGDHGIGRIAYYYDDKTHGIARTVWNFSQVYKEAKVSSETPDRG